MKSFMVVNVINYYDQLLNINRNGVIFQLHMKFVVVQLCHAFLFVVFLVCELSHRLSQVFYYNVFVIQ